MQTNDNTQMERPLADPYAFALLQWPATAMLLQIDQGGWLWGVKILIGLWLAVMLLAAYAGRRPGRMAFGNAMLLSNGCISLGWWLFPSGWAWLTAALALLLLYTGQRALVMGALASERVVDVKDKSTGLGNNEGAPHKASE